MAWMALVSSRIWLETYMAVALAQVEPIDQEVIQTLASPGATTLATVVPRLASAISAMTAPVAVVMDHLELLDNQECLDAVAELAVRSRQAPSWCWPPDARHPCRWRCWAPRARWSRSGPTSWPWTSRRPERCWRVQGPG
jgi:hypothetical protein